MIESPNVLICGLGSVGALKDDKYDDPNNDETVLTHAHACKVFEKNKHLRISAFIDPNVEHLFKAMQKWDVRNGYRSINEYLNHTNEKADIVVIASPTKTHYSAFEEITQAERTSPRLIIMEKPAGNHLDECQLMSRLSKIFNIPIAVNYSRRFCPEITSYKKKFDNNEFGKVLNCTIRYTRGIKRDFCHAIDFYEYFLGKTLSVLPIRDGAIYDYDENDPTIFLHIKTEKCPHVVALPCDGREASVFTIDFYCENARIVFENYGQKIFEYQRRPDSVYGNYKTMPALQTLAFGTSLNKNLISLYRNVLDNLNGKAELGCTIDDAVRVHEVIEMINQQ